MPQITLDTETYEDIISEGKTGRVFVKTISELWDGDTLVSQKVHRRPIEPDADVSAEGDEVKAIATIVRTPPRLGRFALQSHDGNMEGISEDVDVLKAKRDAIQAAMDAEDDAAIVSGIADLNAAYVVAREKTVAAEEAARVARAAEREAERLAAEEAERLLAIEGPQP